MRRTTQVLLAVPVAACAAVLAGCGGSSHAASTATSSTSAPTSVATVTDTVVPPATTASSSSSSATASGPVACATANLAVALGAGDGAAGSSYYPLHLTNKGGSACTVSGFPGVSFVAPGNGVQVGAAAQRSGTAGAAITLAPGAEATALVQVANYANYSPAQCGATAVSGFRVYPPGNTQATYVAFPDGNQQACSADTTASGSPQLLVQSLRAGTTGQ